MLIWIQYLQPRTLNRFQLLFNLWRKHHPNWCCYQLIKVRRTLYIHSVSWIETTVLSLCNKIWWMTAHASWWMWWMAVGCRAQYLSNISPSPQFWSMLLASNFSCSLLEDSKEHNISLSNVHTRSSMALIIVASLFLSFSCHSNSDRCLNCSHRLIYFLLLLNSSASLLAFNCFSFSSNSFNDWLSSSGGSSSAKETNLYQRKIFCGFLLTSFRGL